MENAKANPPPRPVMVESENFSRIYLDGYSQILKDKQGALSIDGALAAEQQFEPNTFGRRNLANNDIYWQRFVIQNGSDQPIRAVLSHEYPIVKDIQIYAMQSGVPQVLASKTDPGSALNKSINFRNFSVPVELRPGSNIFYIKTVTAMAPQSINFILLNPDDFTKLMLRDNSIIFTLLGIVCFSILYNIFIYLQLRQPYYIPYLLFMIFICVSQLVDRGFFHSTFDFQLFKSHDAFLIAFGSAAATVFEIIFIIQFLDLKAIAPYWFKITNLLKWAFIATTAVSVIEYWLNGTMVYSTQMTSIFGLVGIPIFIIVPVYLSIKGHKPAQYFAIATFGMIIFSGVFIALVFGVIPWQEHLDLLVMVGTALQAIFLSIALGRKLRVESDQLNDQLEQHVRDLDIIVAEKTANIRSILDNVKLGIFRINREMKIDPDYSKACAEIFPGLNFGGARAVDAVFNSAEDSGNEQASLFNTALEFSLDQDMISFEINAHVLPKEIIMNNGRFLEMDWTPIPDGVGNLAALLVSAKDVTYIHELESSREHSLEETHNLMNIIKYGQANMIQYIQSERAIIQRTHAAVVAELDNHETKETIGLVMRNVHTIKGNARSFGLDKISSLAHECESQIMSKGLLTDNNAIIQKFLTKIDAAFKELQGIIDKYLNAGKIEARDYQTEVIGYISTIDNFTDKLDPVYKTSMMHLKAFLKSMTGVTLDELLSPMKGDLKRICDILGKKVPTLSINDNGLYISNDHLSGMRSVLNHIVRNSLDHGLELEHERLKAGKPGHGKIVINLTQTQTPEMISRLTPSFRLEFYDDGRGLDVSGIIKKALAIGLISSAQSHTVKEAAEIIFERGFSSKDDVTDISGRGVGMDAIKEFIREIGGTVSIEFFDDAMESHICDPSKELFVPFKFMVNLPVDTCV